MAPELWHGARADTRSDVWAFGALMYALLAGAPPFHGRTSYELATAISTTDPPPLPERVPPALRVLVSRCLEREPGRRLRSASEVHAALEAIAAGVTGAPAVAAPLPTRSRPRAAMALGVALAAAGGLAFLLLLAPALFPKHGRPIASLAVLPLENFSHDADQQYFADGMTDELITRLAQLGVVRVISRTSVMRFRGTTLALPAIARRLGVDAIVEGSIEQVGGRVRITAQLVRAATDEHLWASSYERDVGDALALQDEVAGAIAHEVRGTLATSAIPALPPAPVAHGARAGIAAGAVQAYLRGRDQYEKWTDPAERRALQYLDQALAIDSTFAAAIAARASVLLWFGDSPDTLGLGRAAIAKALALAPDLGEAHAARANLLLEHDWNWAESEREFRRAIELNPNDADAHHQYSHLLVALGRVAEAREQAELMLKLDPLAPAGPNHMEWLDYETGKFDQAEVDFRKTVALDPAYVAGYVQLADLWAVTHRWAKFRQAFEQARKLGGPIDPLYFQFATAAEQGRHEEAVRLLRVMSSAADPYFHDWGELASWSAVLGERDAAFALLDSAYAHHSYRVKFSNLDPAYDGLRSDPRFAALRRRVGLPT
jgi:TolB-like protein/Tfp pilus assembly protein PilF